MISLLIQNFPLHLYCQTVNNIRHEITNLSQQN
nr:MAG TPA: hypothetical protein [Herelleviridae sp.]